MYLTIFFSKAQPLHEIETAIYSLQNIEQSPGVDRK